MADFRPIIDLTAAEPQYDPNAAMRLSQAAVAADQEMEALLAPALQRLRQSQEYDFGAPEEWGGFADDQPATLSALEGVGNGAPPIMHRDMGGFPGSRGPGSRGPGGRGPGGRGRGGMGPGGPNGMGDGRQHFHPGEGEGMSHQDAVDAMQRYMGILSQSESGRALVELAEEMGIQFAIDSQSGVYGYYSPTENVIGINPMAGDAKAVGTLAHELRHAWQFKNGFHTKLEQSPKDNIWMMRVMEADAEANSVKVAAELAEAGYPQVLQAHLQSEYGDEVMAFMHQVEKDPEALKDGRAQRAVFDQWFSRTARRAAYDQQSIEYLEVFSFALDHNKKTQGFDEVKTEWLRGIGAQPDGSNYLDHKKGDMDLDDDFYREGILSPIQERLDHIERRLDGVKKAPPRDDLGGSSSLRYPTRGPANDDRWPGADEPPLAAKRSNDDVPPNPRGLAM